MIFWTVLRNYVILPCHAGVVGRLAPYPSPNLKIVRNCSCIRDAPIYKGGGRTTHPSQACAITLVDLSVHNAPPSDPRNCSCICEQPVYKANDDYMGEEGDTPKPSMRDYISGSVCAQGSTE